MRDAPGLAMRKGSTSQPGVGLPEAADPIPPCTGPERCLGDPDRHEAGVTHWGGRAGLGASGLRGAALVRGASLGDHGWSIPAPAALHRVLPEPL